ncbi:MAG: AraC family transcriptional regulator [Verrucomicrobiota bacterium]
MRVVHETVRRDSSATLSCRDFDLASFDCPYHRHEEFEVLRVDASFGRVLAGDHVGSFEPGEVYVFGSRLPHAFVNRMGTLRARSRCLQFDPARFADAFRELPEMRPIGRLFHNAIRGLVWRGETARPLSKLIDEVFDAEGIARLTSLFRLLEQMEGGEPEILASEGFKLGSPDRHLERLETVLTHIHENSAEALSVSGMARLAGMSETAFHRHFRQRMGRTPKAYLREVRLSNIAQRLLETEANISEIAFAEGFNNLSNFNQQFQRSFHCTPRVYRSRHAAAG